MTAPQVYETASAEIAPATADEARQRSERIRSGMRVLAEWQVDVITAYARRDWDALGYGSWEAYLDGEFGEHRVRLPRAQRRDIVGSMAAANMSTRAIAAAVGTSDFTVREDIKAGARNHAPALPAPPPLHDLDDVIAEAGIDPAELVDDEPAQPPPATPAPAPTPTPRPVTGLDGKTYTRPTARPTQTSRPPLPPQFHAASSDLGRAIARIERLQADDRYRANRAAIANQCLPEIRRAASVLHDLLLDLGHSSGDPAEHPSPR